jgi:hypothetical protein
MTLANTASFAVEPLVAVQIPSEPVQKAVLAFSDQTHMQVLFKFPTKGFEYRTRAVDGVFSPFLALSMMLRGIPVAFSLATSVSHDPAPPILLWAVGDTPSFPGVADSPRPGSFVELDQKAQLAWKMASIARTD